MRAGRGKAVALSAVGLGTATFLWAGVSVWEITAKERQRERLHRRGERVAAMRLTEFRSAQGAGKRPDWDRYRSLVISIGSPSIPSLSAMLEDDDPSCVAFAAYVLGDMGPASGPAVPALLRRQSQLLGSPPRKATFAVLEAIELALGKIQK